MNESDKVRLRQTGMDASTETEQRVLRVGGRFKKKGIEVYVSCTNARVTCKTVGNSLMKCSEARRAGQIGANRSMSRPRFLLKVATTYRGRV